MVLRLVATISWIILKVIKDKLLIGLPFHVSDVAIHIVRGVISMRHVRYRRGGLGLPADNARLLLA